MVDFNSNIEKVCFALDASPSGTIEIKKDTEIIGSISKIDFSHWMIQHPDLKGSALDILNSKNTKPHQTHLLHNNPIVIMAGGKGSRVAPFTKILPKPLIPIQDKAILQIIFEEFARQGSSNFKICLNHKANLIKAFLSQFEMLHDFTYTIEDKPLGTIGALSLLKDSLQSPFFITNCDTIIDSSYQDILNFHITQKNLITIVGCLKFHEISYGVCEFRAGGRLVNFFEKPNFPKIVNTGMYVMSPEILHYIPPHTFFNFTDLLEIARKQDLPISIYPITHGSWKDIGNWKEYKEVTQFIFNQDIA